MRLTVIFCFLSSIAFGQAGFHSLLTGGGTHIVSVESTTAQTFSYNTPFTPDVVLVLPTTRIATLSDASTIIVNVTWAEGDYDETTADTYTVYGTLSGYDAPVTNILNIQASVSITVRSQLTPDLLDNQIMWLRENNDNTSTNVDNWHNDFNRSNDAIKITDARRPNVNAAGIDGNPQYDFTSANADVLRSEAALGITGDFTYYLLFKTSTVAANQVLMENADNGSSFLNTGMFAQIRSTAELWVDFRINNGSDQQRIDVPFSDTGNWNLLEVKHDSSGVGASTNIVKLNGALIRKEGGKDPVVHNSQLLQLGGNGINTTNPLSGSLAEFILTADFHDEVTAMSVLDYFKTTYPTSTTNVHYFNANFYSSLDSLAESWNGLDSIQRNDGKYDFVAASLDGDIYYVEQGATIEDWTFTQIATTGLEIQSLKVLGRDASDRLVLVTAHKDASTTDDDVGKLMIHRANTTADDGAYTSVNLVTGRAFPQDIEVYDIDSDGDPEFFYAYEGSASTEGGIRYYDCSDFSDITNTGVWTEYNVKTHEGAWWMAGFVSIDDTTRLVFTGRNNTARNAAAIPGVYYLTPSSPVTGTWDETTIDATVTDFTHIDFGNFFGNENDIIAISQDTDDVYAYDAGNSFSKTTIVTGGSSGVNYNLVTLQVHINNRDGFITFVEDEWAYWNYYNGSSWSRWRLFRQLGHPGDNEILYFDADDSGTPTVFFDDNTDFSTTTSHIFKFRL